MIICIHTGTHIVLRSRKSLIVRDVFHLQRMAKPKQGTMKAFPKLLRAAIHIILRPRTPLIVRDVFHLQRMAKPEQGTMKAFPKLLRAAIHIPSQKTRRNTCLHPCARGQSIAKRLWGVPNFSIRRTMIWTCNDGCYPYARKIHAKRLLQQQKY